MQKGFLTVNTAKGGEKTLFAKVGMKNIGSLALLVPHLPSCQMRARRS